MKLCIHTPLIKFWFRFILIDFFLYLHIHQPNQGLLDLIFTGWPLRLLLLPLSLISGRRNSAFLSSKKLNEMPSLVFAGSPGVVNYKRRHEQAGGHNWRRAITLCGRRCWWPFCPYEILPPICIDDASARPPLFPGWQLTPWNNAAVWPYLFIH